ncbi:MAG: GH116 family glycosyl-hydrolase [Planctomycetota bacterium]
MALAAVSQSLFGASADPHKLQTFQVEGLKNAASGTVYPASGLEQGGMPLGGLGTGYINLDPDGRLGKTAIFNRYPAPVLLNQPCLFLTLAERRLVLATTPDNKAGGAPAIPAKAVRYFGHFPVADVEYEIDAPLKVALRAYSPFIPGDAVECNTPAAVFEVTLTNLDNKAQSATLAFDPGGFPAGQAAQFAAAGWSGVQVTHKPLEGLPGWVRHTYALAVENGAAHADEQGVRVSAACDLQPGEQRTVRFILAWHQPYLREGSGRVEKNKYAERFNDAQAVAARAAAKHQEWLRRVLAWQDVIYGSALPDWLKEELVNVPYTLTKNSVWLAKTRPDDWWAKRGCSWSMRASRRAR